LADQALPVAYQTLSTTVTPTGLELPTFTFLSMDRERSNDTDTRLEEFEGLQAWTFHPIQVGHGEISELVLQLIAGGGQTSAETTLLRRFGTALYDSVEFPTRNSPIRGQTLSSVVGSGGVLAAMQLFHSGVTPAEAMLGMIITAGGVIIFGVTAAISRALSEGIEDKLKSIFGNARERRVAVKRDNRSETPRAGAQAGEVAFRDAWRLTEDALTQAAIKKSLISQGQRAAELGLLLVARMLALPLEDLNLIDQLRRLNNDLVDGKCSIKITEARKYKKLAAGLAARLLRSAVRKS
jgi:hypothetical protein